MAQTPPSASPGELTAQEWFAAIDELVVKLHKATHVACDTNDGPTGELRVLAQRFADVFEYLVNSSSWDMMQLRPYDRISLLHELEEKVLWRLRR